MAPKLYRIIEHTADTGFEVRGNTKEQVFEAAGLAFFSIMWRIKNPNLTQPEVVEVSGIDLKELLVNFLEEFLYLYDAKGLVCSQLKVENITDTKICSKAWLQPFDEALDQELLGVKAVTYHQLQIEKKDRKWSAQVFLDI